ncbi:class I SAM-dependent methyltransferase [Leifsonia sp. NPDC058248]|uniref:class I SAM-dependent methyltransferase n=1 Tax=Leifsonia sp. NPDC058248 TaxID=3346402 RepID=UPI0036DE2DC3
MSSDDLGPRTLPATQRQRRAWRKLASTYDQKMDRTERRLLAGTREWIGRRASGRVLEVAIGTGRNLSHYDRGVSVTGVDLSPEMLAIARRRAAELGRAVELLEGDAEALPFDDASFDTIVCALALCSIPRAGTAVREMARVVRPGGSVLLVDHIGSTWPPIYAGQWLIERFTIATEGEHLTRRHVNEARSAGLQIVERERLQAGMVERIRATRPG